MPATIMVGVQWGDEGKGKIADFFAANSHICVRFNGGNNAGHTVYDDTGRSIALHLIPVGVRHGAIPIIGPGVVIHFKSLLEEKDYLAGMGTSCDKLMISPEAHLVMPWHIALDWAREKERSEGADVPIGTTLRGIGPCFEDKAGRMYSFRMTELRDKAAFLAKLEKIYREKLRRLAVEKYGPEAIANPKIFPPLEKLRSYFIENIDKILPHIRDDVQKAIRYALEAGKHVFFEGAQGTLLDPDNGTYPFTTAGQTVAKAALDLISISRRDVKIIGIAKAYPTRVGSGPFPTEILTPLGDKLRELGREYGATTGRARRCGWFDAKLTRYASYVNGGFDEIVLTKVDILGLIDEPIKIATQYQSGSFVMSRINEMVPVYEELEPWGPIDPNVRFQDELSDGTRRYIARIRELTRLTISAISIGAGRKAIVT